MFSNLSHDYEAHRPPLPREDVNTCQKHTENVATGTTQKQPPRGREETGRLQQQRGAVDYLFYAKVAMDVTYVDM